MRRVTWRYLMVVALMLALAACTAPPAVPTSQAPTSAAAPAATATPQAAPPTETATAAPSFTPTAAPSPEARPSLEPIPNPFERRTLAPGTKIAEPGLYFMDVATGAIEAWSLPGADRIRYSASPDNRWVIASTTYPYVVADRRSSTAYGLMGARLLAAQGDYLLFFDAGQVWIGGPGHPEPIAVPMRPVGPNPPSVVISADSRTAAILDDGALYLAQLDDGTCRAIAQVAAPPGGSIQSLRLEAAPRGDPIILTAYLSKSAGPEEHPTQWIGRYSWQGERLSEATVPDGARRTYSPDGRLVAWEELAQAVVVADAATLVPRFRATGASICFPDLGGGEWLADSSGLIVRTRDGYRIVTRDGRLTPAPTLGAPGSQWMEDEPLPAPDRPDLFALARRVVVDATGKAVATAPLPADPNRGHPADLYPWGLDSREMRLALPHGGHGGRCGETEYLLPPRVEPAPFGPLALAVGLPAGDCVNLRALPGTSARVLACLPGGTRLSPAPSEEAIPEEGGVMSPTRGSAWAGGRCWLRVRAPDGQEGWVDAEAGKITPYRSPREGE